jgi:TonB family protein
MIVRKSSNASFYQRAVYALLVVFILLLFSPSVHAADRKVLSRVRPEYPPIAKRMKIAGTVLLSVVVSPSGLVKAANFVMGEHVLLEAAQAAVEKWRFEAANDQTTEDVEINFPRDAVDPK